MSSLREQLQAIYDRHGVLTPEIGEREARDPAHPLHSRLEWDDTVGGYKYRLIQMTELIRSVKVVYREATESEPQRAVRAWVATRDSHRYEPVEKVAQDPFLSKLTAREFEREWQAFKRRWLDFEDFARMIRADLDAIAVDN